MPPTAGTVVITGAEGRAGSALIPAFWAAGWRSIGWSRSAFDLDEPSAMPDLRELEAALVVHAAAWTDVDGCAREPELAMRRNGRATEALARACSRASVPLILLSTNEVFDGSRTDGLGYSPADQPNPANPYGASKLAGERWAAEQLDRAALVIVRTAWLFGEGKPDFPAKIAAAARAASTEGRTLRVVADEIGTPTYVLDLASAIVGIAESSLGGIHHVVNGGLTSRAGWARVVVEGLGIEVRIEEISLADFDRPSTPPRWGVLEPTPVPGGPLRSWEEAMADRFAELRESPS